MTDISDAVKYEFDENVAIIRFDDGKANALAPKLLDALHTALDKVAEDEAKAVALVGREGRFSAGFDLSVMKEGPQQSMDMVRRGAELALRVFQSSCPVVIGSTGHAIAMGAVLLLSADERIGAEGPYKIGLNEVAIGMDLPEFALALAEERLSRRHLYRATTLAEIYDPASAVDAGYYDRVVPLEEVGRNAIDRARVLAATLHSRAYQKTKAPMHAAAAARIEASITSMLPKS